jgi:hypothetical protein
MFHWRLPTVVVLQIEGAPRSVPTKVQHTADKCHSPPESAGRRRCRPRSCRRSREATGCRGRPFNRESEPARTQIGRSQYGGTSDKRGRLEKRGAENRELPQRQVRNVRSKQSIFLSLNLAVVFNELSHIKPDGRPSLTALVPTARVWPAAATTARCGCGRAAAAASWQNSKDISETPNP